MFLLGINNVNFYANKSYSVSTKSVSTSLVECISFAEDKQGVFCLLFVVFCLLLSFRWTKSSKTEPDIKQLGSVSCWPLWNYTSKAKRNMACAPQLSKHQAAPKLSTTNKPNRQNTRPLATHSPKEKYGLRSSVEQTWAKRLKGCRSIEYKLKANHRSTSSKTECSGRHYTAYIMRQKVYNYDLVRFRVELLSQKILEYKYKF